MSGSVLVWTTETPSPPAVADDDEIDAWELFVDDTVYAICWCGYEKVAGEPCGLPCV